MIITLQKDLPEIFEKLNDFKNIAVLGCASCATKCQTGGEEAVKKICSELETAGKTISYAAVLDVPCDVRIAKRDLKNVVCDAFLILACGAGVQALEIVTSKPLIPALNPIFTGTVERIGIYNEYCNVCGNCILADTGGICPKTRCAKSLLNGPCGGTVNGKCEVDSTNDCAWALIAKKTNGKALQNFVAPRSYIKPIKLNKTLK